jgi:hypothetical protein
VRFCEPTRQAASANAPEAAAGDTLANVAEDPKFFLKATRLHTAANWSDS